MQLDRARDVTLVVQIRVFVYLGDDEPLVAEVLRKPLRRDQDGLGVAVFSHRLLLSSRFVLGRYRSPGVLRIFQNQ